MEALFTATPEFFKGKKCSELKEFFGEALEFIKQNQAPERILGKIKGELSIIDLFTGSGTGVIASCLFSPASTARTGAILVGFAMLSIGWYKKAKQEKKVLRYLREGDGAMW